MSEATLLPGVKEHVDGMTLQRILSDYRRDGCHAHLKFFVRSSPQKVPPVGSCSAPLLAFVQNTKSRLHITFTSLLAAETRQVRSKMEGLRNLILENSTVLGYALAIQVILSLLLVLVVFKYPIVIYKLYQRYTSITSFFR